MVSREAHHIPIVGLQNSWSVNYHYAGRRNLLNAVAFLYCFYRSQMSTFLWFLSMSQCVSKLLRLGKVNSLKYFVKIAVCWPLEVEHLDAHWWCSPRLGFGVSPV